PPPPSSSANQSVAPVQFPLPQQQRQQSVPMNNIQTVNDVLQMIEQPQTIYTYQNFTIPNTAVTICRGNLPKKAVEQLKNWLFEHFDNPSPNDQEKAELGK